MTPSYYIQIKGAHRLTDAFQAEAGLDFLDGKPREFLGSLAEQDRVFVVLRYLF